jgi:hypothetical protein
MFFAQKPGPTKNANRKITIFGCLGTAKEKNELGIVTPLTTHHALAYCILKSQKTYMKFGFGLEKFVINSRCYCNVIL